MNKATKKSIEILSTPLYKEESLSEKCEKYGIEYHVPSFMPILGFSEDGNAYPKYFVLESEIKNDDFHVLYKKYFHATMDLIPYRFEYDALTPREIIARFRYNSSRRKFNRYLKKNNIKLYSQYERDNYIKKYNTTKEAELKKAKAIVEVVKKEMEQSK